VLPSHQGEQSATAFQLAAALEHYESSVDQLVGRGYDPELHAALTREFEQMRMYASSLPEFSVSWVSLLISRFELTHALWKSTRVTGDPRVMGAHGDHKEAIAGLRKRCTRMLARR
jgi:hypothetical protein